VGCHVEIGEGRNDEGIDGRVWPSKEDRSQPPLVLVQCKRQQDKVSKVVVKALYADVVAEGAKAGIIVTTNALSPGARRVCTARSYPVGEADRETLRKWLAAMRTPGTGVFCGE
jgi:restriction system protein